MCNIHYGKSKDEEAISSDTLREYIYRNQLATVIMRVRQIYQSIDGNLLKTDIIRKFITSDLIFKHDYVYRVDIVK